MTQQDYAFQAMVHGKQTHRCKGAHSVHYFNYSRSPFHNLQFQFSVVEGKSRVWDEIEQLKRNEGFGELSEKHSNIGGAKAVK